MSYPAPPAYYRPETPPPPDYGPGDEPSSYDRCPTPPPPDYEPEETPPAYYRSPTPPPPDYEPEETPPAYYRSPTPPPPDYEPEKTPPVYKRRIPKRTIPGIPPRTHPYAFRERPHYEQHTRNEEQARERYENLLREKKMREQRENLRPFPYTSKKVFPDYNYLFGFTLRRTDPETNQEIDVNIIQPCIRENWAGDRMFIGNPDNHEKYIRAKEFIYCVPIHCERNNMTLFIDVDDWAKFSRKDPYERAIIIKTVPFLTIRNSLIYCTSGEGFEDLEIRNVVGYYILSGILDSEILRKVAQRLYSRILYVLHLAVVEFIDTHDDYTREECADYFKDPQNKYGYRYLGDLFKDVSHKLSSARYFERNRVYTQNFIHFTSSYKNVLDWLLGDFKEQEMMRVFKHLNMAIEWHDLQDPYALKYNRRLK